MVPRGVSAGDLAQNKPAGPWQAHNFFYFTIGTPMLHTSGIQLSKTWGTHVSCV